MWGSDAKVEAADATGEAIIIKAGFLLSAVESDSLRALSSSGVIVFFCTTLVRLDCARKVLTTLAQKAQSATVTRKYAQDKSPSPGLYPVLFVFSFEEA